MITYFQNICKQIYEKIKKTIQREEQIYQETIENYKHQGERCPNCGAVGRLNPYGSYWRYMVYEIEIKIEDKRIKILRFKCKSCGVTHALLPDILIPYSSYTLSFKISVLLEYFKREKTVVSICKHFGIAVSTLYAWKKQLLEHKELLIGVVESKKTDALAFLRKFLDSIEISELLQDFWRRYGFSFLQSKRQTTQSVPP